MFFSTGNRYPWWNILLPTVYVPAAGDGYVYLSLEEAFRLPRFDVTGWIDSNFFSKRLDSLNDDGKDLVV